jgi:hypothetical protein
MNKAIRTAVAVVVALLPGMVLGQATSNKSLSITGRVTDPTGAPIRDVAVKLKLATQTEIAATTKTSQTGEFKFLAVPPQSYELHFYSRGFKQEVRTVSIEEETDIGSVALSVANLGGVLVEAYSIPTLAPDPSETPTTLAATPEGPPLSVGSDAESASCVFNDLNQMRPISPPLHLLYLVNADYKYVAQLRISVRS